MVHKVKTILVVVLTLAAALACACLLASCAKGLVRPLFESGANITVFQVQSLQLPELAKDAGVYQFWLGAAEKRIPLVKFVVAQKQLWPPEYLDEDPASLPPGLKSYGTLTSTELAIDLPEGVTKKDIDTVFITIEERDAADTTISTSILLMGAVNVRGRANMTFDAQAVHVGLPDVFSGDAGKVKLAVPTFVPTGAAGEETPFYEGVWFVTTPEGGGTPVSSLVLPDLTGVTGWSYQGWAFNATLGDTGTLLSLGRFKNPLAADDDGAGTLAGAGAPYAAPGSDFLAADPPYDFRAAGWTFYITVEPDPDLSPAGFAWQLLSAPTKLDLTADQELDMAPYAGLRSFGIARIL